MENVFKLYKVYLCSNKIFHLCYLYYVKCNKNYISGKSIKVESALCFHMKLNIYKCESYS